MAKKGYRLGVKISLICSVLTIITAMIASTITAFLYTGNMRDITYTLVSSGTQTIEAERFKPA